MGFDVKSKLVLLALELDGSSLLLFASGIIALECLLWFLLRVFAFWRECFLTFYQTFMILQTDNHYAMIIFRIQTNKFNYDLLNFSKLFLITLLGALIATAALSLVQYFLKIFLSPSAS